MSVSAANNTPHKPVIAAPAALVCVAALLGLVVAAAMARHDVAMAPPLAKIVRERALLFTDRADGAVVVTDAHDRQIVAVAVGQQGFLRQTMRGLALYRQSQGGKMNAPFTLTYYADRRLILRDPATGQQVELEAFGPLNEQVFARLLSG